MLLRFEYLEDLIYWPPFPEKHNGLIPPSTGALRNRESRAGLDGRTGATGDSPEHGRKVGARRTTSGPPTPATKFLAMNLGMSSIIGTYSAASARLGPGFGQTGFVSSGHFGNADNLSWYEGVEEST